MVQFYKRGSVVVGGYGLTPAAPEGNWRKVLPSFRVRVADPMNRRDLIIVKQLIHSLIPINPLYKCFTGQYPVKFLFKTGTYVD